jgi:hypothetical protein
MLYIKDDLQKHFCVIGWCLVRQINSQARTYGFKNLQARKKPTTVTRQLTKSQDFRQKYLCDFHLWALLYYFRLC